MILEGLVTTQDETGRVNLAPMGPIVAPDMSRLLLRPFQTSQTFQNLRQQPCGVLHVTDDVELIARAALHGLTDVPPTIPAQVISGQVLTSACRWYEFRITNIDDTQPRAELTAEVVHSGTLREFFGFNRAKHAVLEATILATRLHLLPASEVQGELQRLQPLVDKTAGPAEAAAWEFVKNYIDRWNLSAMGD